MLLTLRYKHNLLAGGKHSLLLCCHNLASHPWLHSTIQDSTLKSLVEQNVGMLFSLSRLRTCEISTSSKICPLCFRASWRKLWLIFCLFLSLHPILLSSSAEKKTQRHTHLCTLIHTHFYTPTAVCALHIGPS